MLYAAAAAAFAAANSRDRIFLSFVVALEKFTFANAGGYSPSLEAN